MKKYDPDATCVKCGSGKKAKSRYYEPDPADIRVGSIPADDPGYIQRTCKNCGHAWDEVPLDRKSNFDKYVDLMVGHVAKVCSVSPDKLLMEFESQKHADNTDPGGINATCEAAEPTRDFRKEYAAINIRDFAGHVSPARSESDRRKLINDTAEEAMDENTQRVCDIWREEKPMSSPFQEFLDKAIESQKEQAKADTAIRVGDVVDARNDEEYPFHQEMEVMWIDRGGWYSLRIICTGMAAGERKKSDLTLIRRGPKVHTFGYVTWNNFVDAAIPYVNNGSNKPFAKLKGKTGTLTFKEDTQ